MNALAEAEGFLVAYSAQSGRANGQRCWNWFQPGDQGRESGEAGIIAGLTARSSPSTASTRRGSTSPASRRAGAAAANVARAYPDLYAAVGIHSGLAAGCAPRRLDGPDRDAPRPRGASGDLADPEVRVPTIVFHG